MSRKSLSAGQKGLTAKERKQVGFTDRINGLTPQYPKDGYYMQGYNSDEIRKRKLENLNSQTAAAEAIAIELGVAV